MQRRVGDRLLDRFRIDAVFTGGLGVLCAVTDLHSGRRYAVKTVKDEHKGNPAVVRRFLEEASTWIALGRHDFLVQAYWMVEDAPEPYLFLEFVEGEDLAALLARGPLPLPRALDLAMQCTTGMAYAHTKALEGGGVGVVHLDLKPTNLLIGRGDLLKVTDFGLARVVGAPRDADGPREGTPAYMAPEQLQGDAPLDGRTDVYSFGLVLLEMLLGENPLRAETFAEQVRRALEIEPPPPADVPEELAALVARCVAKDPDRRPRDFMEVLAHLARTARGLEHAWHVDPKSVAAPRRPAGIVLEGPALRPRRPRSGEPFGAVLTVRGDVGRGPVDLEWRPAPGPGLEVVGAARSRVEAGGRVHLTLRATLLAHAEGPARLRESTLAVRGPEAEAVHRVPECPIEVVYAFQAPLVGREEVVARFRELLLQGGGALFVRGGLGLGKTRLLQEFARIAAAEGRNAVVGRAQAAGLRPMRLLNETARALLDLPAMEPGSVRAAVNALLGHEPAAARYFIDVLTGDLALDPEAPPAHAWFALLRAAAARAPLALLLDDLHHADESAVRILRELIDRAAESKLPVVFAGTLRGDEPDLPAADLAPLTRADVGRLLDGVFPGHGFAEEAPWLAPAIATATAGNPFHAAEILRALRVGPDAPIRRRQGEWRVDDALSPETLDDLVPAAVEDAVVARARGLPKTARRVLELAALAGEEFDAAVVREALGDGAAAEAALGELEDRGLIRPVAGPGLDRYRLWTAALAPALRRQLQARAPVRARQLHAAVARGMLVVYRDETRTRMALSIAQHLRAAGEAARSLPLTLAGCRRLLGLQLAESARRVLHGSRTIAEEAGGELRLRFDYLYGLACEATGDYDAGSEALTRFVEAGVPLPEEPRAVPRAYVRLGRIHKARGEYDRAQYSFGAALQLLDEMGDRRTSAFVLDSLAELALLRRRYDEAESLLAQAAARAEETGNEAAVIQTLIVKGDLDVARERAGPARRALEEAAKRAEWLGDRRRWAAALEGLGRAALESGYLDEARERLEKAVDLRAWMGDRPGVARGLLLLGTVHHAAARIDQALRNYRRALRVFLEVGQKEGVAEARLQAGRVLHARGKTTAAVKDLAAAAEEYAALGLPDRYRALHALGRALADAGSERPARLALARADRGAPSRTQRVFSRVVRARLALDEGRVERARRLAERAVRRAARTTGHLGRVLAHLALAEAALAGGDLETARRGAETALAFAREEGRRLQAARAERIFAELAALEGRLEEAAVHAHRAARAYTGRRDTGDGPARLLLGLARGLAQRAPERAARYRRAARRCYARLEAQGFRAPSEPAMSHEP